MDGLIDTLLAANHLKSIPRTGWTMRGVPEAETIAAHSYGVALLALTLAEAAGDTAPLDRGRVLAMALLHDLAESQIGDLPAPARRFFPQNAKETAEDAAMHELLGALPGGDRLLGLWRDYQSQAGPEARLVQDADRLDTLMQALVYRQRTGNRALGEFWDGDLARTPFNYAVSRDIYVVLRERYDRLRAGE